MKAHIVSPFIALLLAAGVVHAQDKIHPDVAQGVKDNNRFALELYGNLAAKDGNVFLSPYSISTALAMTYAGAKGETAAQMAKTMHYTLPNDKLHAVFGALIRYQNDPDGKRAYKLSVANRLWGQKKYTFHDDFLQLIKKNYGAGLQEVDFRQDTDGARKTINEWVDKETFGKIKDLVPEGVLDDDSRLVLTNAIYFKAAWFDQFAVGETKKGDFWTTAKEKVQAEELAKQYDGLSASFTRKSGENDQLFGSVTSSDIAEALGKKGFELDRRKIQLHEPLKTVGEFMVPVKLHKDVTVHLKIVIEKEASE